MREYKRKKESGGVERIKRGSKVQGEIRRINR